MFVLRDCSKAKPILLASLSSESHNEFFNMTLRDCILLNLNSHPKKLQLPTSPIWTSTNWSTTFISCAWYILKRINYKIFENLHAEPLDVLQRINRFIT